MVYLSFYLSFAFICFLCSVLFILFSKKTLQIFFGLVLLFMSGTFFLLTVQLTAEALLFSLLGLFAILLILFFYTRDRIVDVTTISNTRSGKNEHN